MIEDLKAAFKQGFWNAINSIKADLKDPWVWVGIVLLALLLAYLDVNNLM